MKNYGRPVPNTNCLFYSQWLKRICAASRCVAVELRKLIQIDKGTVCQVRSDPIRRRSLKTHQLVTAKALFDSAESIADRIGRISGPRTGSDAAIELNRLYGWNLILSFLCSYLPKLARFEEIDAGLYISEYEIEQPKLR